MEQYSPRHLVGVGEHRVRSGWDDYADINTQVPSEDVAMLRAHARSVGLWRFEEAPRWESDGLAG